MAPFNQALLLLRKLRVQIGEARDEFIVSYLHDIQNTLKTMKTDNESQVQTIQGL